jgi:hypothetical protein
MPSLKAKPGSGCAVGTKVIGQYSPRHSDWHVQCGPKIRISFGTGVAVWTTNRIEIFLKGQAQSLESQDE